MSAENDLIQRLMISKKIMEKHDTIGRGGVGKITVDEYQPVNASYNIPQELISEQPVNINYPSAMSPVMEATIPKYNGEAPTPDRILKSNLPDEIKQLMMEHPIVQPNSMVAPSLPDDLINKAARLMNTNAKGEIVNEVVKPRTNQQPQQYGVNLDDIRNVVRETVEEVLKENGLMVESTSKSNESFRFKVGQHIFEGKVTKIKKVSQ
jgi:hypothetical protein